VCVRAFGGASEYVEECVRVRESAFESARQSASESDWEKGVCASVLGCFIIKSAWESVCPECVRLCLRYMRVREGGAPDASE
jgi:hypothetical protein